MNLYLLSVSLSKNNYSESISDFDAKEIPTGYIVKGRVNGRNKRVRRREMLIPITTMREDVYTGIYYSCWFYQGGYDEAIKITREKILQQLRLREESVNGMKTAIKNMTQ